MPASVTQPYTLNDFPNGVFVTDASRIIIYCNNYFLTDLEWTPDALIGKSADIIFTLASKVFYQTYLIPTLLHEDSCEEMQLMERESVFPSRLTLKAIIRGLSIGVF